jgi:proline iminopeptidase
MYPRTLYPEISPFHTDFLLVSALHTLYYEECGNPQGQPVIFLHGGPGTGVAPSHRQFFDPAFYRIILFDQRGAGKSTPSGELRENTTWDLVADLEKLRTHLGIARWLVFGGSWGSTLALSYAITHPHPVLGLILRGIFLCRSSEIAWMYQDGASHVFPEAWEKFIAKIPAGERGSMVEAYYRRLTAEAPAEDPSGRLEAARSWNDWENSILHLYPKTDSVPEDPQHTLSLARIECHYMNHRAFMESDTYLLENLARIRPIPCRIVQGRYDMCCPAVTAWEVSKALPQAGLRLVPDAGHSAFEPGIASDLVQAADDFKELFSQ